MLKRVAPSYMRHFSEFPVFCRAGQFRGPRGELDCHPGRMGKIPVTTVRSTPLAGSTIEQLLNGRCFIMLAVLPGVWRLSGFSLPPLLLTWFYFYLARVFFILQSGCSRVGRSV